MGGAGKRAKHVWGGSCPCGFSCPSDTPCVGFVFALALCAGKAKHELAVPSDTHFHCCWGHGEHAKPLDIWGRALSLQSPEHSPFSSQAGEIQLSNSCDSTHGLWLRGLSGQDVLGHKLDKGTVADGAGNTSGSVGSACSPQEPTRFGSLPSVFPANARARLQSCLTSDEFGPGLKMSVDVLLPHDKRAGV